MENAFSDMAVPFIIFCLLVVNVIAACNPDYRASWKRRLNFEDPLGFDMWRKHWRLGIIQLLLFAAAGLSIMWGS